MLPIFEIRICYGIIVIYHVNGGMRVCCCLIHIARQYFPVLIVFLCLTYRRYLQTNYHSNNKQWFYVRTHNLLQREVSLLFGFPFDGRRHSGIAQFHKFNNATNDVAWLLRSCDMLDEHQTVRWNATANINHMKN